MSVKYLLQAFATVFPAELPDKTMIATIILVTRYRRPGWVWLGAVSAFTVHVIVAVAAGSAISLLPETLVKVVVATLFAVGAVLLFRSARNPEEEDTDTEIVTGATVRATVLGSFGLILLAKSVRSQGARTALLLMSMTIPPLIAISRVYLGVHYPSDVVGALFLGNAWVLLWSEVAPLSCSTDDTSSLASTR